MKYTREMARLNWVHRHPIKRQRLRRVNFPFTRSILNTDQSKQANKRGKSVWNEQSQTQGLCVSDSGGKKTMEKAIMPSHIKNSETQHPLVKQCTSSKGKMEPKLVLSEAPSPLSNLDYDVSLFLFSDPSIPSHWIYETWFCPTTLIKLSCSMRTLFKAL